jgi:hypothetical protein
MTFSFELATPNDDIELRQLLANTPMPGRLTISFQREPNYFLGCPSMGHFWQVIVARHLPDGNIAGVMCRAIRPYWINGQCVNLGYIGQIRIAEQYRSQWLLWRGFDFFRNLHADNRTSTYFGVISDENTIARGLLIDKPSRHFPKAHHIASIYTLGIILRRPKKPSPSAFTVQRGTLKQLPAIGAFFEKHGAEKQFFPAYTAQDFISDTTRGFKVDDFVIARRDDTIVGIMGLWDQSSYKQSIVQRYNGSLRWVRPMYNAGLRLISARPLPGIGEKIHTVFASFICIADNNPGIFQILLRELYSMANERNYAYLMLGLVESDPLLSVARKYLHIAYHSQLYIAGWDSSLEFDDRIPYIEIAML